MLWRWDTIWEKITVLWRLCFDWYRTFGKIANEDFWSPPPIGSILQKIGGKIRIDSEWPNSARNRKKNFCPLVTPPRKKLRKIFKIFFQKFFESCSESSETSRKLKISKKNFFSYDQKKLRKIFKKKIFQKFFESCSESSETWKKLKKKFSLFSLYRSRT